MRKLTVFVKLFGAEINVTCRRISKALFNKSRNNADNSVDIFGGLGMNGGLTDIKSLGIGPELLDIAVGDLGNGNTLLVGLLMYSFSSTIS